MADVDTETADDEPWRDPGLARERTALAWNRSGLALLAAVAIMLRRLWPLQGGTAVTILAVMAAGATTWAVGMFLVRRSPGSPATATPGRAGGSDASGLMGVRTCRILTAGTLLLALAGLLLGVLSVP
jgi:hypothetical protein